MTKQQPSTVPSEHAEQVAFVKWFRLQYPKVMIFAIPNGGARHALVGAKLKAEGVLPGVPDLFAPALNLWVEMKREKASYPTQTQKEMHIQLHEIGHSVIIGYGCRDAQEKVANYIKNTELSQKK